MSLPKPRTAGPRMLLAVAVMALAAATAGAQEPTSTAEVTRVDKAGATVTLKHGEIRNLDMPPMTMVFRVKPPQLLEGVVVGDRVRFAAERIDGTYTVVALVKAP